MNFSERCNASLAGHASHLFPGLNRLETASFLLSNAPFLTDVPSFPDPQTSLRFLHQVPDVSWQEMRRVNDRLLQTFIQLPSQRSRLVFDLDSTLVTIF